MESEDARVLIAAVDAMRADVSAMRTALSELLVAVRTLDETTRESAVTISAMIKRWGT